MQRETGFEASTNDSCDRDFYDCIVQLYGGQVYASALQGSELALKNQTPGANIAKDAIRQIAVNSIRAQVGVSDAEARTTAKAYANQALADHKYIKEKLTLYGDAVRSKGKKATQNKRETLILKAQPSLYRHQSVEQRVTYRWNTNGVDLSKAALESSTYRNAWLLPYLNVESLKQEPMRLLNILHHRSSSALTEWVALDMDTMKLGFESGCLMLKYNENCLVLNGPRYGDLVPYDRIEAHLYIIVGYPRGVFVLEAQAVLMRFLRNMLDVSINTETHQGSATWSALAPVGFKADNEEHLSSFAQRPFSASPTFRPSEALMRVKTQLAAAEDHLYLMQTDPAYLQNLLIKERRREHFSKMSPDKMWEILVADIMVYPIQHVRRLRDLVDELENVDIIHDKFKDQVNIGSPLPRKYDRAMSALEFLCINLFQRERQRLDHLLRALPGFHKNYNYLKLEGGKSGSTLREIKGSKYISVDQGYIVEDPLHYALLKLTKDPEDHDAPNVAWLMAFIDDHLASNEKDRCRIDQNLYDHLSRMCCYYELVSRVRLQRPCSRSIHGYAAMNDDKLSRRIWRLWRSTPGNLTSQESDDLVKLLRLFCDAVWPNGKRDAAWLAQSTKARQHLAAFWARARQIRKREVTGIGFMQADIDEDVALFSADNTDEFREEVYAERAGAEGQVAADGQATAQKLSDGEKVTQTVWENDMGQKKFELPVGRAKEKTRGTPVHLSKEVAEQAEEVEEPCPCISVTGASLDIFARMFPTSAGDAFIGLVKWQQVVAAIADAGFAATHTGGSAVHFSSVSDEAGSIVFHKPHPDPNIDPVMLQAMGKRMRKWFGWDRKIFVEREKKR